MDGHGLLRKRKTAGVLDGVQAAAMMGNDSGAGRRQLPATTEQRLVTRAHVWEVPGVDEEVGHWVRLKKEQLYVLTGSVKKCPPTFLSGNATILDGLVPNLVLIHQELHCISGEET